MGPGCLSYKAEVWRPCLGSPRQQRNSCQASIPRTWEEVKAGKESTDGFSGPCYIARKWTPYEISIVSIPADGTVGVGRAEENTDGKDMADLSMYENIVKMNENKLRL